MNEKNEIDQKICLQLQPHGFSNVLVGFNAIIYIYVYIYVYILMLMLMLMLMMLLLLLLMMMMITHIPCYENCAIARRYFRFFNLTVPPGTHCCVEDRGLLRGGAPSGQVSPRGKGTSRTMVLSENHKTHHYPILSHEHVHFRGKFPSFSPIWKYMAVSGSDIHLLCWFTGG